MHGTGAIDSEKTTHILRVEGWCPSSSRGAVSWWLFLLTLATREKRKGEKSHNHPQQRA
jgi:hypothetical protein